MRNTEILLTIAEIAIALAGFSGVVAFLGNRAQGEWRSADLIRFKNLLNYSIAALLFSFFPIIFFELGVSEPTAWRTPQVSVASWPRNRIRTGPSFCPTACSGVTRVLRMPRRI